MKSNPKEGIYAHAQLAHFAVQQKLTQHCKGTPIKINLKKNIMWLGVL